MNIPKGPLPYYLVGAFFLFLLLFPFPESQTTFSWNSTCDALHLPLFFMVNITLIKFLETVLKKRINFALTSSISLFIVGLTIEIIQPYFSRGFSYRDMATNFLGILLSYLFVSKHTNRQRLLQFSSVFAFLFVTIPIVNSYLLYKERISSFPVLFDPDTRLIEVATPSYESELKIDLPNCGLKVIPSNDPWSGVKIDFGYTNWTKFKQLRITLSNPNELDIELGLRIDDNGDNSDFDSRYNEIIKIPANQTINLELPMSIIKRKVKNRNFNLKSLDRALLFPLNSASPFCIRKIELK